MNEPSKDIAQALKYDDMALLYDSYKTKSPKIILDKMKSIAETDISTPRTNESFKLHLVSLLEWTMEKVNK